MQKKLIYILIGCILFGYGFYAGSNKAFPFPQMLAAKHYFENYTGTFEARQEQVSSNKLEVQETLLQRLLIKKVKIPEFNGYGGGISTSGNLLYIVTNKGSVKVYNLETYDTTEDAVTDVPMNFSKLILSGHPYKNEFSIPRFRVNGIHSETVDQETHWLFVSHNAYDSKKDCITHNVSRTTIRSNDGSITQEEDWETIFTASPCIDPEPKQFMKSEKPYSGHISGGAMVNFDQQHLIITVGDYNRNGLAGTPEWAIDSSNPYGKFILLDKETGKWSIYAMGSRNPTGLYIDEQSTIWSVENGPKGGDELNIIQKGENYGWPKVSYGVWYHPELKLSKNNQEGTHFEYKKPIFSWIPSVAPSSLIKIKGQKFKYWRGDLLMGTMRNQSLRRLRLDNQNRVIYDERIHLNHRVRDLITLEDNKLALVTDDGYLIIIDDGGPVSREINIKEKQRKALLNKFDRFMPKSDTLSATNVDVKSPSEVFGQNCKACHNINTSNQIGPHLHNLLNRKVGELDNYNYSRSLKNDTRIWDTQLLRSYLKEPEAEFPGTQMQKINLTPEELDSLIDFFKTQNTDNQ